MNTKRTVVLGLLLIAVGLASCGGADVETGIVGYWEGEVIRQDLSFSPNGEVTIVDHKYSNYSGTYRITDGNVLTCDINHNIFTEPIVYEAKIRGDKLILKDEGREQIYRRRAGSKAGL